MSKEKEDKCIELLENLLAKYPESLEELLDFLINAEQFYRENKEYIENRDYNTQPKIIIMKAKYMGRAKPLPYKEDNE